MTRIVFGALVAAWGVSLAYWVWRSAYPRMLESIPEPADDWDSAFGRLLHMRKAGL